MGQLQPGVGYNVIQSPHGDALEILFPDQPAPIVQQFQTEIVEGGATAKIRVAKGAALIAGAGQGRSSEGMKEWWLNHYAVFPTGARTVGTDSNSKYASNGGTVTINAGSVEGGSDVWYVYLLANNYDNEYVDSAYPMLAIVADSSDAWAKSTPFDANGDIRYFGYANRVVAVSVIQPDMSTVSGNLFISSEKYLQNYNCQRITLARLHWNGSAWDISQFAYGPVTFTDDVRPGANVNLEAGDPIPTPNYSTEQTAWEGTWTGYTKDFGDDLLPI